MTTDHHSPIATPANERKWDALRVERLTYSELKVLRSLSEGQVPKKIAIAEGVKVSTVRSHIKSVHGKLGAHSTVEALFQARRYGLL